MKSRLKICHGWVVLYFIAFHSSLKHSIMNCLKEERKAFSLSKLPFIQTSRDLYDFRQSFILPNQLLFLLVLVIRLSLSLIKACLRNLVLGSVQSLNQYLTAETVLSMYRSYLPVSPYIMWLGVLSLTLNSLLHAKRSALSMFEVLDIPKISEAFKSMGLVCG